MNPSNHTPWSRLVAAARRAPEQPAGESVAPAGFATRVVAHAGLRRRETGLGVGLDRLAARMLGIAAVCAVATVLWAGLPGAGEVRASGVTDTDLDPVGVLLEAAQP